MISASLPPATVQRRSSATVLPGVTAPGRNRPAASSASNCFAASVSRANPAEIASRNPQQTYVANKIVGRNGVHQRAFRVTARIQSAAPTSALPLGNGRYSRNVRIAEFDTGTGANTAQYIYPLKSLRT
jgi:hypothetical protein